MKRTMSSRNLDAAHSLVALAHCMDHQQRPTPRILIPVDGTQLIHYQDRNSPKSTGSSSCTSHNTWTSDQSSNGIISSSCSASSSKSVASPVSPSFPSPTQSTVPSPSSTTQVLTFQDTAKAQVIFSANPFMSHPLLVVATNSNNPGLVTQGDSIVGQPVVEKVPSSSSVMDSDGSLYMVARILADLKSVKQDHPSGSPVPVHYPSSLSPTTPTSITMGDHDSHHSLIHPTLDGTTAANTSSSRRTRGSKGCINRYVCPYPGCGKIYGKSFVSICHLDPPQSIFYSY